MNPQQRDLLNKAQESLNAAKLLKNNNYFDYAVSRAYKKAHDTRKALRFSAEM